MSHNITIESGTSVRLPTAGKYCDRDIVITATGGSEQPKKILRYIKFVVNEVRGSGTQMQFSEIDFLDANGNRFNYPSTTVVTSPDMPATASAEGQDKIIDGLTTTKFCTVKFASGKYLLIDLGGGNGLDVRKYGYWQWWTGNDNAARDPISFELWGSENGDTYELLDSADKVDVTTTRQAVAYANWVHISEEPPNEGDAEDLDAVLTEQEALIEELKAVLAGKASGVDYLASRLNGEIKTYTSDEVTTTPNYAFYNCSSLESISLPSCTWVATAAFQNCTSLKSINFPSATKGGGTCFRGCSLLTNVNMPLTTELSTYAFAQCSSLKNIDLPSFTTLGGAMFQDCTSLERANIPLAKSIGAMCFQGCSALAVVIIKQTTAVCSMAAVTAFEGTPIADGTGYVYVPKALVDRYKSATNWSTYAAQIRAIEDYPDITGG